MKISGFLLTICLAMMCIHSFAEKERNDKPLTPASYLMNSPDDTEPRYVLPLYKDSPVIYDNDDHRDVYTDEYLLALSSLGEINLKGIITTYSASEYEEFVKGREEIIALAQRCRLKNLPKLFNGTNQKLVRPENNRIEETKPLDIDGSRFIVEIARKCSFSKPLVIITGGQLTSIANAWLLDPSIADKVVVFGIFGTTEITYNAGLDAWAWTIILAKFKVAAIPDNDRGVVFHKPAVVPKARIQKELNQDIPFFKWMYEKKHPTNSGPDEADYDGHPAILITRPDYVTKWRMYQFEGVDVQGKPILSENENGTILQAEDATRDIATNEFWRVTINLK
jgi:hypothetical protein